MPGESQERAEFDERRSDLFLNPMLHDQPTRFSIRSLNSRLGHRRNRRPASFFLRCVPFVRMLISPIVTRAPLRDRRGLDIWILPATMSVDREPIEQEKKRNPLLPPLETSSWKDRYPFPPLSPYPGEVLGAAFANEQHPLGLFQMPERVEGRLLRPVREIPGLPSR